MNPEKFLLCEKSENLSGVSSPHYVLNIGLFWDNYIKGKSGKHYFCGDWTENNMGFKKKNLHIIEIVKCNSANAFIYQSTESAVAVA